MNQAFGDTSFFVALISLRDVHHDLADSLGKEYRGQIVTNHWVLVEVANFFAGSQRRSTAMQFIDSLLNEPLMKIDPATAESFRAGWELYSNRADKSWSLTDCISMNTMCVRGLRQALSSDHHFEQAGFEILLK